MAKAEPLRNRALLLPDISDSADWEKAVEALLLDMATAIDGGIMMKADYTRKTQELAEMRRALLPQAETDESHIQRLIGEIRAPFKGWHAS